MTTSWIFQLIFEDNFILSKVIDDHLITFLALVNDSTTYEQHITIYNRSR